MAVVSAGCYTAPVMPPPGIAFGDIQAPLDTNVDRTVVSSRSGEASTSTFLGMVSMGDASIETAARNGGLKVVHHADYQYKNIFFFFYQKFTVRVYGE
jgi:hypothetical protein